MGPMTGTVHLDNLKTGRLFAMSAGKFAFKVIRSLVTTTHQVTEGRSVEPPVDAVHLNASELTVAELADTGLQESAAIDRAIKMMSDDRLQQSHLNADNAIRDADEERAAE
jgi:hypothetical protein